jgi:hypothetical protein
MFVWDIVNDQYYNGNPYTNIIKIVGKNNNLVINYLNNIIEFTFTIYKNDGLKKYIELTSIGRDERTGIHNLKLVIYDKNKNIYISNISKSNKISGKKIVKLAEIISKKIGASYVYLFDGTSTVCKYNKLNDNNNKPYNTVDLSLYLLLKNKKTYYQQLGYKLDISSNYATVLSPNKSAEKTLTYFLKKINKLELSNINKNNNLVLDELKKSIINNNKIKIIPIRGNSIMKDIKNNYSLYNTFLIYSNIYTFLPKKGNLVDELLKLYNKNCNIYNFIIDTISNNEFSSNNEFGYKYEFLKNTYTLEEIYLLSMLVKYRENINWNGYFIKKL